MAMMVTLVTLVLVSVVMGRGGYEPWAAMAVELGAAACAVSLVFLFSRHDERTGRRLREHHAWKQLPRAARYPFWKRLRRGGSCDIAIEGADSVTPRRHSLLFGIPFPRTGLAAPLCLLTVWIGLSVVPVERGILEILSPAAHELRAQVEPWAAGSPSRATVSLVPFLTLRDLWLWLAYLVFFYVGFIVSKRRESLGQLTGMLIAVGAVLGAWGLFSSLAGWRHLLDNAAASATVRAAVGFGNPNHYAAFLSMIFFCGLGGLTAPRGRGGGSPASARGRLRDQEALGKNMVVALALALVALGILFSLSRSAIAFTTLTVALFVALTRGEADGASERSRAGGGRAVVGGMVLSILALAAWVGVGPVLERFHRLSESLEADVSRRQVMLDSLSAAEDFWMTGSGLGSYRYITAQYRSFPGRVFYSWAHNDYLQLLIELGAPGLVLLLWLAALVLARARRARDALVSHPELRRRHAGYLAATLVIALHSFTDFSLHLPANFVLLAVIVGVVVGTESTAAARSPRRHPSLPR